MTRRDMIDIFGPEFELMDVDPFIREICTGDDLIDDHRFNYEWLGESAEAGEAEAVRIEASRLSFELETLYRWWAL